MEREEKTSRGKERVYAILDGNVENAPTTPELSLLKQLSTQDTPGLVGWEKPIVRGIFRVCAVLLILFALQAIDAPNSMKILVLLVAASLAFDSGIRALDEQRKLRRVTFNLQGPLLELKSVRDRLNTYLENVDRRTSRYFHCVTNTKLTTFCVLRQMQGSIEERISHIEKLLTWPTNNSISEAFDYLKQVLLFRDGIIRDTGQVFTTPLHELRQKVDLLVEDLDIGLEVLEDTIKIPKRVVDDESKIN